MAYSKLRGARKTKKKDDEKSKLLAEDAFQEHGKKLVDRLLDQPYFVLGSVGLVILLVIIFTFISGLVQSRNDRLSLEYSNALEVYTTRVEESPEFNTEAEKLRKSVELFENIVKNQRSNINAAASYLYMGKAYYRLNDFGKAREAFQKARKSNVLGEELSFGAYEGEALTYYDNNEYEKAAAIWKKWLAKRTDFYKDHALYYIGKSLAKAGRKDDSIAYFKRLRNEYPQSSLTPKIIDKIPAKEKEL